MQNKTKQSNFMKITCLYEYSIYLYFLLCMFCKVLAYLFYNEILSFYALSMNNDTLPHDRILDGKFYLILMK